MIKHISLLFTALTLVAWQQVYGQAESTVVDIDGNTYKTVVIDGKEWMAENLRTARYRDGSEILTDQTFNQWQLATQGIWANFDNNVANDAIYGKLYNWYATIDPRGLCPTGWRVPTDNDWQQLIDYTDTNAWGNSNNAGQKLKSRRQVDSPLGGLFNTTEHPRWDKHSTRFGTDEYGFGALPAGYYAVSDAFVLKGVGTYFWSVTENKDGNIWVRFFKNSNRGVSRMHQSKIVGLSVRCVKDAESTAQVPQINTLQPENITTSSALLGGEVSLDGGSAILARGFVWGTDENPSIALNGGLVEKGSGLGVFTETITGLTPGSTYWARAFATNSEGTAYGVQKMIEIPSALSLPTVQTRTISGVSETTAIVGGSVTSGGGALVTARGVVWSTSPNPSIITNEGLLNIGEGTGTFASTLEDLQSRTTYYIRAFATNSQGTAYGNQLQFTTLVGVDLEYGLVAFYPFNGNANDESGYDNHGTVNGATLTTDRFGIPNAAYLFNGSSWIEALHKSHINFGRSDEYTVSLWVKASPENGSAGILEKWVDGSNPYPYVLRTANGKFQAARYIGGYPQDDTRVQYAIGNDVDPAGFQHVVAVFKPNTIELFLNGILVATSQSQLVDGNVTNNNNLFIGRRGGSTLRFFKGVIDDIRIYSRAISAEEILTLYNEEGPEIPVFELVLAVNPAGTGSVLGGGSYTAGSEVALSASPNQGYQFVNWTEAGNLVSTQKDFTYTMPGNSITLSANFELIPPTKYSLTLLASPSGAGQVQGAGSYAKDEVVALTATATQGYKFVNWTQNGNEVSSESSFSFTMPEGEVNLTANFEVIPPTLYTLSVDVNPANAGQGIGAGEYEQGEEVELKATANQGFTFVSWTIDGNIVSTDATYLYAMQGSNVAITANFDEVVPDVNTVVFENALGRLGEEIVINVHMVNQSVVVGFQMEILIPDGFAFVEGSHTLTDRAQDHALEYNVLDGNVVRISASSVTSEPFTGSDGVLFSFNLKAPTQSGDFSIEARNVVLSNSALENVFTASTPGNITVTENTEGFKLAVVINPSQAGTVTGAGYYNEGEHITLTATPLVGYKFVSWTLGAVLISTQPTLSTFMPAEDVVLTANFAEDI